MQRTLRIFGDFTPISAMEEVVHGRIAEWRDVMRAHPGTEISKQATYAVFELQWTLSRIRKIQLKKPKGLGGEAKE